MANTTDFIDKIYDQVRENGGVTVAYPNGVSIFNDDAWYFPIQPNSTQITDFDNLRTQLSDFIDQNEQLLLQSGYFLGVWQDPATGKLHIDVNIRIEDTQKAVERARAISTSSDYKIKSIYNIRRDKEISIEP